MLLYGDYHTHSIYSRNHHGKGTVLENASVAADKGLKQIAITDHGFNHEFFGIRRKNIPSLQEDILNAKEITGVDILLGVEANLISLDGDVDVREEDYEFLDIFLMGYHKMVHTSSMKDRFVRHIHPKIQCIPSSDCHARGIHRYACDFWWRIII